MNPMTLSGYRAARADATSFRSSPKPGPSLASSSASGPGRGAIPNAMALSTGAIARM